MVDYDMVRVVRLTNEARARHGGLRPVRWDKRLERAARRHSKRMARRGFIFHDEPGGPQWWKTVKRFFKLNVAIGQNVAGGFDNPERVHDAWMNSPLHRKNILDPRFRRIGVARVGEYWTQNFGG